MQDKSRQQQLLFAGAVFLSAIGVGVLVRLHPLFAIAALIGVLVVLFLVRDPILGLLLLTLALPFERIGAYEFAGTTIRISQVLLPVITAAWVFNGSVRRSIRTPVYPIALPMIAFLIVNLFGLLGAPNLERAALILAVTAFTMGVSMLLPTLVRTETAVRRVVGALFWTTVVVSCFGLFQFFGDVLGLPQTLTGLRDLYTKDVLGFPRIQSTALEPLYFANFLLLPLSIAFALFLKGGGEVKRFWLIFVLLLAGINLILTVSRGGYLGVAAAFGVIGILSLRSLLTPKRIIAISIVAVLVYSVAVRALGAGGDLNLETFASHVQNVFFGASFVERVETIEQAIGAFQSSPWIGVGPGGFGPYAAVHPYAIPDGGWLIVNNEYIELLAETGILGSLAILALLVILFTRSFKAHRTLTSTYLHAVHLGTVAALVGILVQFLTFSTLYIMHVWFAIGLLIAVQTRILRKHP